MVWAVLSNSVSLRVRQCAVSRPVPCLSASKTRRTIHGECYDGSWSHAVFTFFSFPMSLWRVFALPLDHGDEKVESRGQVSSSFFRFPPSKYEHVIVFFDVVSSGAELTVAPVSIWLIVVEILILESVMGSFIWVVRGTFVYKVVVCPDRVVVCSECMIVFNFVGPMHCSVITCSCPNVDCRTTATRSNEVLSNLAHYPSFSVPHSTRHILRRSQLLISSGTRILTCCTFRVWRRIRCMYSYMDSLSRLFDRKVLLE